MKYRFKVQREGQFVSPELSAGLLRLDRLFLPDSISGHVDWDEWMEKISKSSIRIFAFDNENTMVGAAVFYANDMLSRRAFLTMLVCDGKEWGSGLSDMIMNELKGISFCRGMDALRFKVIRDNLRAIKFYERHGFRQIEDLGSRLMFDGALI